MADGTVLPRFKRAFITKCEAAGIVNVAYQSPMQPEDMFGGDGSGSAGWFDDHATGDLQIKVMGAPGLWVDETWQVPFIVQVLGTDTDADQETVDQSACELLGQVIALFADPSFGIATDSAIQTFAAVPVGANPWHGGVLPSNLRAAGFKLTIELRSRLRIT